MNKTFLSPSGLRQKKPRFTSNSTSHSTLALVTKYFQNDHFELSSLSPFSISISSALGRTLITIFPIDTRSTSYLLPVLVHSHPSLPCALQPGCGDLSKCKMIISHPHSTALLKSLHCLLNYRAKPQLFIAYQILQNSSSNLSCHTSTCTDAPAIQKYLHFLETFLPLYLLFPLPRLPVYSMSDELLLVPQDPVEKFSLL